MPLLLVLMLCAATNAAAQTLQLPVASVQLLMDEFAASAALDSVDFEEHIAVKKKLVPLGAMQKVRGVWAPEVSERVNGELSRATWRLADGFQSRELVDELDAVLASDPNVSLIFSCDARACGSSSQWANRIFGERLLYGVEASQRYRAYAVSSATEGSGVENDSSAEGDKQRGAPMDYRLLVYGSSRGSSRQYLRVEVIQGQLIADEERL